MSRIRGNIVANVIGRGWSVILGIAILPLYVRFLGAEAYGLVGLYASISAICSLFDAGISASLGRELARVGVSDTAGKQTADLVRTAEVIYAGIGGVLGGAIVLAAPWIVTRWLNLRELNPDDATRAVRLMGLYFVLQWPTGLYLAALAGLQRQVEANVVTLLGTTLRGAGSVLVLWKISSNITAFYCWQVIATGAFLLLSRETIWRVRGVERQNATFQWPAMYRVRGFAGGVTLLSLLSVAATQMDKVVLTRLVSLQSFGYYAFASSVAGMVAVFGQPVLGATYPALIEAFTSRDHLRLSSVFHRASQLVSVAIFAPAAVLCAFAPLVLRLWTRDAITAENTWALVSVSLVGVALNGGALMPYNLTLAAGNVRPAIAAALGGVAVYAAALAILAPRMGVMAGAVGGSIVDIVGLFIYARFAVDPLLPGQGVRWLVTDTLVPLLAAGVVAGGIRLVASPRTSQSTQVTGLVLASLATMVCSSLVTSSVRQEIILRIRALRSARVQ